MKRNILDWGMAGLLAMPMLLGVQPVSAQNETQDVLGLGGITPVGLWEDEKRESRYDVTLCGDGTQLCAELVWIRPRLKNERNTQYLNEFVVFEAERARPAEWKGDINIYGTVYGGSLKLLAYDRVMVTGCVLILCESFELFRKRNPDGSRYEMPEAAGDA